MVLTGLSRSDLRALQRAELSRDGWTALLRVSVETPAGAAAPIFGSYTIAGGNVRFTPVLPFEPGRRFAVVFDPNAAPHNALHGVDGFSRVVATPAPPPAPAVHVTSVYPTGPVVPANLLRMYVEFSGSMGSMPADPYITLVDGQGNEIKGALLPLDTELWDGERRRFTILFDPGRVKRGILPNRAMGRPLHPGGTFTIVIKKDWPDAHGQPLSAEFRKTYQVGAPIERALSTATWTVSAPAAASRDPLRVTFPHPLDRGLVQRSLTVLRDGAELPGDFAVEQAETGWRFTPRDPWLAGDYVISVLPALEDPSGNRLDRAFETLDESDDTRRDPARVPFTIRPR